MGSKIPGIVSPKDRQTHPTVSKHLQHENVSLGVANQRLGKAVE
jgi:hypothetical protein